MAIGNKKYIVRWSQEERETLTRLVRGGKAAARKITRARILLKADAGAGGAGLDRSADCGDVGGRGSHGGEPASPLCRGGVGSSRRGSTQARCASWMALERPS